MSIRIAVLASGRGSNMQRIVESCESGFIPGEVVLVVSDKESSQALDYASKKNIKALFLDPKLYDSKEDYDKEVVRNLMQEGINIVCLAGFMRILTPYFVKSFKNKILNIHPAVLPLFHGSNAQEQAITSGVKFSGCTVHFVDEGVDTGKRILQAVVEVHDNDTIDSLSDRILKQEHRIYPLVVRLFAEGRVSDDGTIDDAGYEAFLADFNYNDDLFVPSLSSVLISVSDKHGVVEFAKQLVSLMPWIKIMASGGTAKLLSEAEIRVNPISEVTKFPECFGGRVKTLHPVIAGGILFDRDNKDHVEEAEALGINPVDVVVCNLYPFSKAAANNSPEDELIENIDIGGVTLIRAAAKNHKHVAVVVSPSDYSKVIDELRAKMQISDSLKKSLALKAFSHTAEYDEEISKELSMRLSGKVEGQNLKLKYSFSKSLRYGENPHQQAEFYVEDGGFFSGLVQIHGKELSFNNIVDVDAAWSSVKDISNFPAVSIIKHTNPCGYATGNTLAQAFERAWQGDDVSAFGSIIAFSQELDEETALMIKHKFVEVLIAPSYSKEAVDVLSKKEDLRILQAPSPSNNSKELRFVNSGVLVQSHDDVLANEVKVVSVHEFPDDLRRLAAFSYKAVKHVKSNAIVIARQYDDSNFQVLGIGAGQPNRVNSVMLACEKARENLRKEAVKLGLHEERHVAEQLRKCVLASDAFFPFKDNIEIAHRYGIKNIVQPGGSKRDDEVVQACNRLGIAMMFTGTRHFKH